MRALSKIILIILLVGVGGWLWYQPYWTVHQMQTAAKAEDMNALSEYIDFEQVRLHLKQDLSQDFNRHLQKAGITEDFKHSTIGSIGTAFADALIDKTVDVMVSPEALSVFLSYHDVKKSDITDPADSEHASSKSLPDSSKYDVTMGYDDLNHFSVRVAKKADDSPVVRFVLARQQLNTWRMVEIKPSEWPMN